MRLCSSRTHLKNNIKLKQARRNTKKKQYWNEHEEHLPPPLPPQLLPAQQGLEGAVCCSAAVWWSAVWKISSSVVKCSVLKSSVVKSSDVVLSKEPEEALPRIGHTPLHSLPSRCTAPFTFLLNHIEIFVLFLQRAAPKALNPTIIIWCVFCMV